MQLKKHRSSSTSHSRWSRTTTKREGYRCVNRPTTGKLDSAHKRHVQAANALAAAIPPYKLDGHKREYSQTSVDGQDVTQRCPRVNGGVDGTRPDLRTPQGVRGLS